jgi:hypothetical protein
MPAGEVQKLADYADRARTEKGATSEAAKAQARERGGELAKRLDLACEITDAELIGGSRKSRDSDPVGTAVYEVACKSGMGYVLVQHGAEKPLGMSCLAAEGARAADEAQGVKTSLYCQLPANKDVKATAAALLAPTGTSCTVRDARWFGQNTQRQLDYTEVACEEGNGYLISTAKPGAQAATGVMSCVDAARAGTRCRLTDAGPVESAPTMDVLKQSLVKNGVQCQVGQMRLVGRESVSKRYVFEVQCNERHESLIAFVPTGDSSKALETINCAAASLRGVACVLTAGN